MGSLTCPQTLTSSSSSSSGSAAGHGLAQERIQVECKGLRPAPGSAADCPGHPRLRLPPRLGVSVRGPSRMTRPIAQVRGPCNGRACRTDSGNRLFADNTEDLTVRGHQHPAGGEGTERRQRCGGWMQDRVTQQSVATVPRGLRQYPPDVGRLQCGVDCQV
jgi:hypothetical protein